MLRSIGVVVLALGFIGLPTAASGEDAEDHANWVEIEETGPESTSVIESDVEEPAPDLENSEGTLQASDGGPVSVSSSSGEPQKETMPDVSTMPDIPVTASGIGIGLGLLMGFDSGERPPFELNMEAVRFELTGANNPLDRAFNFVTTNGTSEVSVATPAASPAFASPFECPFDMACGAHGVLPKSAYEAYGRQEAAQEKQAATKLDDRDADGNQLTAPETDYELPEGWVIDPERGLEYNWDEWKRQQDARVYISSIGADPSDAQASSSKGSGAKSASQASGSDDDEELEVDGGWELPAGEPTDKRFVQDRMGYFDFPSSSPEGVEAVEAPKQDGNGDVESDDEELDLDLLPEELAAMSMEEWTAYMVRHRFGEFVRGYFDANEQAIVAPVGVNPLKDWNGNTEAIPVAKASPPDPTGDGGDSEVVPLRPSQLVGESEGGAGWLIDLTTGSRIDPTDLVTPGSIDPSQEADWDKPKW